MSKTLKAFDYRSKHEVLVTTFDGTLAHAKAITEALQDSPYVFSFTQSKEKGEGYLIFKGGSFYCRKGQQIVVKTNKINSYPGLGQIIDDKFYEDFDRESDGSA